MNPAPTPPRPPRPGFMWVWEPTTGRQYEMQCGPVVTMHVMPKADACDHDFKGWQADADGLGGQQVCAKCGMGAMAYTLGDGT